MDRSNRLCEELIPTYTYFEPYSGEEFVGYKLVEKWNLNYYSIVTGLFRYKPGKIKHSSYSGLHIHLVISRCGLFRRKLN